MKNVNQFVRPIPLALLAAALGVPGLVGCASVAPPAELVAARSAYGSAAVNATEGAPTELHAARLALDQAELTYKKDPTSVLVRDRAYIAVRRSEVASTRAAIFRSKERLDISTERLRALGVQAAGELGDTRKSLNASKAEAGAAARDVSGLKIDLQVAESKADGLGAQLATEKQARHDAEVRLTSTLQAMHDLQSVKEDPRGLVITLSGAVLFASGKSVLLPAARAALDNVAEALKAMPDRTIRVEGHTDSQGTTTSNMELSRRRGDAVRSYLVSRGIPEANIRSTGFGPEQPIAENTTPEGRANNRRVEIVLAPAPAEMR